MTSGQLAAACLFSPNNSVFKAYSKLTKIQKQKDLLWSESSHVTWPTESSEVTDRWSDSGKVTSKVKCQVKWLRWSDLSQVKWLTGEVTQAKWL